MRYRVTQATLVFILCLSAFDCAATEPSSVAQQEITHLLTYLERSECEFFRNGSWYSAADAKSHLNRKYAYLLKKGWAHTAEDFIRLAATKSSMSGKEYRVRCSDTPPMPSETWLREELARYRQRSVDAK